MAKTKTKKASAKKATAKKAATKKKAAGSSSSEEATSSKEDGKPSRPAPAFKPRADEDAGLDDDQMLELYGKLIDERVRVLRGLDKHLGEAVTDIDPLADEVDVATRHAEQAYLIRFADKERKLLREIDHALEKMREGDYGLCEGTDEPIGFPRLSVRPWTRYSVRYKEELEREKRSRQV
ncbi:MAG: hypothetical protein AAGN82_20775 [Myxococcota bacterium]